MKIELTSHTVRGLKPRDKAYEVRDTNVQNFVLRVYPSGIKTYWVTYRIGRRRRRHKIGSASVLSPSVARKQARRALADVEKGKDPAEAKEARKAHTIGSYLEEVYKPEVLDSQPSGAATYNRIQANFKAFLKRPLDDPTLYNATRNWRSGRVKAGRSKVTVNRDVSALRSLFSEAIRGKEIKLHPLADLSPLKQDDNARVRYLSQDEWGRLTAALDAREERLRRERESANAWRRARGYTEFSDLRAVPYADRLKPLTLLALNTGLRRGELFGLEWKSVFLDAAYPHLKVASTTTKTRTIRHVQLNATAQRILQEWQKQSGGREELVFPGRDGKTRLDNIKSSWGGLLKEAEITGFTFHDCRHDFASRLVMAGVDLNTVRELLGHADLKMTIRYAHLAPKTKAAAVAMLDTQFDNVVPFDAAAGETE